MEKRDIQHFMNRHCRFKLRSGKEIFGVMWSKGKETDVFFATYAELVRAGKENISYLTGSRVNLEEVVLAEPIGE